MNTPVHDVTESIVTVTNPRGLHARSALQIATAAQKFNLTGTIGGESITSVLFMLTLGAGPGTELIVRIVGGTTETRQAMLEVLHRAIGPEESASEDHLASAS